MNVKNVICSILKSRLHAVDQQAFDVVNAVASVGIGSYFNLRYDSLVSNVSLFERSVQVGEFSYKYAASRNQPCLYASVYAVMIEGLCGRLCSRPKPELTAWGDYLNGFQSAKDGLYYDAALAGPAYEHVGCWNEGWGKPHQQERIVSRLFKAMFNTLANKKIAVFGFAFKADTGDTRETPAGVVARLLFDEHVRLAITDPKALPNTKKDLSDLTGEVVSSGGSIGQINKQAPIEFVEDPYAAAKDADAILLMTDWKQYKELDWTKLYSSMRKPALVFDTRNCLDCTMLNAVGFKVLKIGK